MEYELWDSELDWERDDWVHEESYVLEELKEKQDTYKYDNE